MKGLWIGRVEILTEPTEFGDTKAFTNVVARAKNAADFRQFVSSVCEKYDWSLIGVEVCNLASDLVGVTSEELLEALNRAKDYPEACIFTTLYYYSSKPS
jgi:sulfur relay (sulfurtransferase) complex TusBCD TusD component (DsrE family)